MESKVVTESLFIKDMKKHYGFFGGLCLLYGILYALCLYHNLNGITYPVFILITMAVAYLLLKKIGFTVKKNTWIYMVGMILLGIGTAMTSSGFLIFFNSAGIFLLFLTAMMHQFYEDGTWSFPIYVKKIIKVCLMTVGHIYYPFSHGFSYLAGAKEGKRKNMAAIGAGILIAVVLLVFVFPMLLRSDMIFAGIFEDMIRNIRFGTIFEIGFMVITGFIGSYAFFSALCTDREDECAKDEKRTVDVLIGITFTGVLGAVYVFYSGIQVLYLFLKVGNLPQGVTYAEYARQGFFELLFVGIVNFVLVLVCMRLFGQNKVLYGILTIISGCTFVMIASAAYRMILYVQAYHLTFLRLLVMWCLMVLALIMAGVVVSIYREKFPLFRYIVLVVGCGYILFSLGRPDRLVAEYNIRHMETVSIQDLNYMIYGLSDDAAPVLARLDPEKITSHIYNEEMGAYEDWEVDGQQELRTYFADLASNYEDLTFREWNLSKIQARNAANRAGMY